MVGDKDETFRLLEWIDGTLRRDDEEAAELLRRVSQSAPDPSKRAAAPRGNTRAPVTASKAPLVAQERGYTGPEIAAYIRQYYPEDNVLQALADRLDPIDEASTAGKAAGTWSEIRED